MWWGIKRWIASFLQCLKGVLRVIIVVSFMIQRKTNRNFNKIIYKITCNLIKFQIQKICCPIFKLYIICLILYCYNLILIYLIIIIITSLYSIKMVFRKTTLSLKKIMNDFLIYIIDILKCLVFINKYNYFYFN